MYGHFDIEILLSQCYFVFSELWSSILWYSQPSMSPQVVHPCIQPTIHFKYTEKKPCAFFEYEHFFHVLTL